MKKYGNQTPTKSVILDYDKSLGHEAVEIYEKTGRSPYPWQEKMINDLFAMNDEDLWTHSKFGYSIPRRNGKTEIVYMAELWGLFHGLNILHTAHRISTSHSSFEKLKNLMTENGKQNALYNAKRIAYTEVSRAFSKASLSAYKESGLKSISGLLNKMVGLVAYVMLLTAKSLMLIVL